jgi:hypothetical protein
MDLCIEPDDYGGEWQLLAGDKKCPLGLELRIPVIPAHGQFW